MALILEDTSAEEVLMDPHKGDGSDLKIGLLGLAIAMAGLFAVVAVAHFMAL